MHTYNNTKFLIIFLVIFAALGTFRIAEKNSAVEFYQDENIKVYPTMNPFDWYAVAADENKISVFEYNGLERASLYNETVPRIGTLSQGDGLDDAISAADDLPQVKMLRWRAYAVAINASFSGGVWLLEYYDPLPRAMFRDSTAVFRRINAPIRVKVEGGRAVVL